MSPRTIRAPCEAARRGHTGLVGALLAVGCLLSSTGAFPQSVYQCPGPNGQKVFQQAPCTDGTRVNAKPVPKMGGSMLGTPQQHRMAVDSARQQEAIERRETKVRIAIQQRRVLMGMTESELRAALGAPVETNVGVHGGGTRITKQWVYRQKNGDFNYVYTTDGIVTDMQWKERPQPEPKLKAF